jgi:uncharacterized protein
MGVRTDVFSLEGLGLQAGEGRRFEFEVGVEDVLVGSERYGVAPASMPVVLDLSRTTHAGWAMRLRFEMRLSGPCMRCLEPAEPGFPADLREVSIPGGGDDLTSPYVSDAGELDLRAWVQDAVRLTIPDQILCRPDCAGLCPVCGENLNEWVAGDRIHEHEREPDPRWAALRDLKLE